MHCAHGGPLCTNKYSFFAIVVVHAMLQVENGLYLGELYCTILYLIQGGIWKGLSKVLCRSLNTRGGPRHL